jgi:hypothetical protein
MNGNDVVRLDPALGLLPIEKSELASPSAPIIFDTFLASRIRIGLVVG